MSYEHAIVWLAAFCLLLLVNLISLVTFAILHQRQALGSYRDVGPEILLWADLTFLAALSAFSQAGFRGSLVWFAIAVGWRLAAKPRPSTKEPGTKRPDRALKIWKIVGWVWVGWNTFILLFGLLGLLA